MTCPTNKSGARPRPSAATNYSPNSHYHGYTTTGGSISVAGTSGNISVTGTTVSNAIKTPSPKIIIGGSGQSTSPKTDIQYVIVRDNGSCIELDPPMDMTPREIIGFSKFFSAVSALSMGGSVDIEWSSIIADLGIERHWCLGCPHWSQYDNTQSTLYILLFDAP